MLRASEPHGSTVMYEDGPTGSIEALKLCWLLMHRGSPAASQSVLSCKKGMFITMSAINNCNEIWDLRPEVRRDQWR